MNSPAHCITDWLQISSDSCAILHSRHLAFYGLCNRPSIDPFLHALLCVFSSLTAWKSCKVLQGSLRNWDMKKNLTLSTTAWCIVTNWPNGVRNAKSIFLDIYRVCVLQAGSQNRFWAKTTCTLKGCRSFSTTHSLWRKPRLCPSSPPKAPPPLQKCTKISLGGTLIST